MVSSGVDEIAVAVAAVALLHFYQHVVAINFDCFHQHFCINQNWNFSQPLFSIQCTLFTIIITNQFYRFSKTLAYER